MTAKLVARLSASGARATDGTVHLDQDGIKTELTRVTEIRADAEGNFEVRMWTDDFDAELEISELTAEAILRSQASKQLAFLNDTDAAALRTMYDHNALLSISEGEVAVTALMLPEAAMAIRKIIAELNRRKEIPF